MNSKRSGISERSARMSDQTATGTCLLFVGSGGKSAQAGLRQKANLRHWLTLDVELLETENGPWMGAAMPGSPNGCGIFARAEGGEFFARSDSEGVYLSATLDQLLSANRIRNIFLIGDAPDSFIDGMRSFAVAYGYGFRLGSPDETNGSDGRSLAAGARFRLPSIARKRSLASHRFSERFLCPRWRNRAHGRAYANDRRRCSPFA